MKKLMLFLFAFISLNSFAKVSPQEAYQEAKEGKAVLIDVREKSEIQDGMLSQAKWFPLSKITSDGDWLPDFKKIIDGKKVFLYCRSGNRSGKVKHILEKQGLKSVNLGGYQELKKVLPTQRP